MRKNLMVGVSGVRGVVGESLTPDVVTKYSSAFGMLCQSGKVVLGRDTRVSGEMVRAAVVCGLLSTGCEVIDLGICATPTVEIAVRELKANGGIIITASHNPIQWNALKFVGADGIFLSEREGRRLSDLVEKDRIKHARWDKLGKVKFDDSWTEKHVNGVLKLSHINVQKIKKRKFRVVLDCVNGAGGVISPDLLRALGCKVIELNCKPDGNFAHDPEPIPRNLTSLCRAVKKHKADLGFANDPDVDRLAIVSEKGMALGEEATLALATKFVLSRKPHSKLAANISTSRMIDDIALECGSKVYRTKVGEAHVARQLRKVKGVIGGEGNGGVILPEFHYGRDALVGMALILQYLAESEKPMSQLFSELPGYFMVKRKAELTKNFEKNLVKLKKSFARGRINPLDGIRIDFEDSWLHIRKSNTEPLVRVIAEAKSKREASKLVTEGLKILGQT
ncbi:MAG: phosphoglucosamine mutase [Candidatus Zixiibacteriota bacterium]